MVALFFRFVVPKTVQDEARAHAERTVDPPSHRSGVAGGGSKWTALAHAFVMDWMILWKELIGGFIIVGFIATLVPPARWQTMFLENGPRAFA